MTAFFTHETLWGETMMQDRAVMEQVLSLVATSESNCDAWLGDDDKFLATS